MGFRTRFGFDGLSPEAMRAIDRIASDYERRRRDGETPEIEPLLATLAESSRAPLFGELLAIEFEECEPRGVAALAERTRARFPAWRAIVDAVAAARLAQLEASRPTESLDSDEASDREVTNRAGASPRAESPRADAPRAEAPRRRDRIRDYRLIRKIGEGGMGTVYLAVHTRLEKRVALKLLRLDRSRDEQYVSRFKREMKAVGKLQHPNIVAALDAGEVEGRHFLAMEFVEGIDLARLVRRLGPVPYPDACEIVGQTAEALQHAHGAGLIHRDVKPSNLMLSTTGSVKLLDLGLAFAGPLAIDSQLTRIGQIVGTPGYMAPEQGRDGGSAEPRSDLYSLGLVMRELLTGRPPSSAGVRPIELGSDGRSGGIPVSVRDLLQRLLADDPQSRPASAAELLRELAPFRIGHDLESLVERYRTRLQLERTTRAMPAGAIEPPPMQPASAVSRVDGRLPWGVAIVAIGVALVASAFGLLSGPWHPGAAESAEGASTERAGIVRVRELPEGISEGDVLLRRREDGVETILRCGDQRLSPGLYRVVAAPGLNVDEFDIEVGADEVLLLSVPTLRFADVTALPPHLPHLSELSGAFARYAGAVKRRYEDGTAQEIFPELTLTSLGDETRGSTRLAWLNVELQYEDRHEFAILAVDRRVFDEEHRLEIVDGWIGMTPPDSMRRMQEGIGETWVAEFEAGRDAIAEAHAEWGYLLPEGRLGILDLLVLLFDVQAPGADSEIRAIRGAIDAAADRHVGRKRASDPRGGPPIECLEIAASSGTDAPERERLSFEALREAQPKRLPFGFVAAQVETASFCAKLNLRTYGQRSDAAGLEETRAAMQAALERRRSYGDVRIPDFVKVTFPTRPGSWSRIDGSLTQAGGQERTFELEMLDLGPGEYEGKRLHWVDFDLLTFGVRETRNRYRVAFDDAAYRERQEPLLFGLWELNDGLTVDLNADASLRNAAFGWLGFDSDPPSISITEALVLLFDAKGMPDGTRLESLREEVSTELVRRSKERRRVPAIFRTRNGRELRTDRWLLEADSPEDIVYRIGRSESVPFDFTEVDLQVPRMIDLKVRLVDYGVRPVESPPTFEAMRAGWEATLARLNERGVRPWHKPDGGLIGLLRYDRYGYDGDRRRFLAVTSAWSGERRLLNAASIAPADLAWLVAREGRFWTNESGETFGPAVPIGWSSGVIVLVDAEGNERHWRRADDTDPGRREARLSTSDWQHLRERLEHPISMPAVVEEDEKRR